MLLLIAVLAIVSAAFLLFRYSRRQVPYISEHNFVSDDPPQHARPLFAPTDDELRRDTSEKEARSIAQREYRARAEARAAVDDALSKWRERPDAVSSAELLRVSAESGLSGAFSRSAGEIVEMFDRSGINGLTAGSLAALLDSHYRILPAGELGSGELFWLNEEIARLAEQS